MSLAIPLFLAMALASAAGLELVAARRVDARARSAGFSVRASLEELLAASTHGVGNLALWPAGLFYTIVHPLAVPTVFGASVDTSTSLAAASRGGSEWLGNHVLEIVAGLLGFVLWVALLFVAARFAAGLAWFVSAAADGARRTEPSEKGTAAAWLAGRGATRATFGISALIALYAVGAMVFLIVPWAALRFAVADSEWAAELLGGILVVAAAYLAMYTLLLIVLQQLAIQSLVRNGRGATAALLHAWRLVRRDPRSALAAAGGEVLLIAAGGVLLLAILASKDAFGIAVATLVALACLVPCAYLGVVRARFWARAYPRLGGLGPDDGVPGLD